MNYLEKINFFTFVLLTAFYFYQIIYIFVVILKKQKSEKYIVKKQHRYGVVIAARNEGVVIANLIESIKQQKYPSKLIDIFVVADNCTDNTAEVAKNAGAIVYERFNKTFVGKGYALDFIFKKIAQDYGDSTYDAYFIFDADNILDKHFIAEMNKVFDKGYNIITSYRNSKNYGTNWITAGYSLWFLRESKYLNNARMLLNTTSAISGTGFLLSSSVVRKNNGWKYHLLTEDIELSVSNAIDGETIGYCPEAKFYDEQPETFSQSWTQRLRWSKGFYQVMSKYGLKLCKTMFKSKKSFMPCYDMLMTITPALFISLSVALINLSALIYGTFNPLKMKFVMPVAFGGFVSFFVGTYFILFIIGLVTTITEWKNIKCEVYKKILYTFTFPLFIQTYIPISIVALFKNVEWKPINHTVVITANELNKMD